ncbi:hypothetical protein CK203_089327 [Vitis vinifera]|uniref:Uncharacterized protein n=1 Tax=Vitis vinifera TaxID=29760 RepID=A0A438D2T9_VITVI|nr:hypothetical protein CK203_089327 [Vitis vinifera]
MKDNLLGKGLLQKIELALGALTISCHFQNQDGFISLFSGIMFNSEPGQNWVNSSWPGGDLDSLLVLGCKRGKFPSSYLCLTLGAKFKARQFGT